MRRKYFGLAMAAIATLGPGQAFGGDREIAQSIMQRLQVSRDAGDLKHFNLDMKVNDGVVLFRGKVSGTEQRDLVLGSSQGIEGIRDVVDELAIEKSIAVVDSKPATLYRPKAKKTDAADAGEFAQALSESDAISPMMPEVAFNSNRSTPAAQEVVPGIVQPTAAYDGPSIPNLPTEPIATLSEPTAVASPTKRGPAPITTPVAKVSSVNDEQLTAMVVRAIGRARTEGHIQNFGIDVNSYEGMIELEGTASSAQQREFLANIAAHAPGARGVRNLIEVASTDQSLQALPQGNQPRMAAAPTSQPMMRPPMPQQSMQRGQMPMQAQTASYGGYNQQVINGEMVVPGSMVNHAGNVPMAGSPVGGQYGGGQINGAPIMGAPVPMAPSAPAGAPRYDSPNLPNYAWPGYAAYPNYAALSYPQQYSPSAFPYIGPFYPYPQVPLGWRKVSLEWDDGWWFLDFTDK